MATYLVTGGAGFIGSHVVEELCRRGDRVRVLDNLTTGRPANLAGLSGIDYQQGDVCDPVAAERATSGVDFVVHLAADPSVTRSIDAPLQTHRSNALGTLVLLEAARRAGVRRVVYAGSSSAYGDAVELPKRESMPAAPRSPYAASKLAGEQYALAWWPCYGLQTVVLRYFNVFGPRQDPDSPYAAVVPRFIAAALAGEPPTVYGDGRQTRDFCYVSDTVWATLAACVAARAVGQVINVGRGQACDLLAVIAELRGLIDRPILPRFEPARQGDIRDSVADIARARDLLDFSPQVSLHEGLARTVAWARRDQP